jgi:hypothetical protein
MLKGFQVVRGFAAFVLFVLSFSVSTGFAQDPCDSYANAAYAEEVAQDVVKEDLNYWAPLDFSAIVMNCHYYAYEAVTEFTVFTDWLAYDGSDYFRATFTLTFVGKKVYWALADANSAAWEHINSTDLPLDILELLLAAASE